MSNRLQNGNVPYPSFNTSLRASQPYSTHSQKLCSLFLTQKRRYNQHEAEIVERHAELNHYIEQLDEKVHRIVQHNEAELLFAYRNHLQSVKLQLQEFKQETQQALEGQTINREKIQIMQKQLTIFRQEALKLFEKALKKDKQIQQLQFRLDEILSEKKHMDNTVKSLIKRNKELQAALQAAQDDKQGRLQKGHFLKIEVNSFVSLGLSSHKKMLTKDRRIKDRVLTKSFNNSKAFTQQNFNSKQFTQPNYDAEFEYHQRTSDAELFAQKLKLRLSFFEPQILSTVVESATELYSLFNNKTNNNTGKYRNETFQPRQTKSSLRSKSFHTCESNEKIKKSLSRYNHHRQLSSDGSNSELRDLFKKCVQVVRKDIARRKQIHTLNFFKDSCPISLQEFKKVDFMKLIEKVFSNQKLIQVIYWNLFNTAP